MEFDNDPIYDTIKLSRELQPIAEDMDWSISDVLAKVTEELGEFSEAVQIERGKLKKKKRVLDAPFYEAADVMQCLLDALSRLYPDRSPAQICILVHHALRSKDMKWENGLRLEAASMEEDSAL